MGHYPSELPLLLGCQLLRKEFPIVKREFKLMDIWGYDPDTGHTIEIEVKCNDYDFYKEFNKPCKQDKHINYRMSAGNWQGYCPTRFYFMLPRIFAPRAIEYMEHQNWWYRKYGIIAYDRNDNTCLLWKKSDCLTHKTYKGYLPIKPYSKMRYRKVKL